MSKVRYPFAPTPVNLASAWYQVSTFARAMGGEAFRVTLGEWFDGGRDWTETLCSKMAAHGKERPNIKRALRDLREVGLIEANGQRLRVLFYPEGHLPERSQVDVRSPSDGCQVALRSPSGGSQVDVRSELSVGNDSTQVVQKERKKERKKEWSAPDGAGPVAALELSPHEPAETPKPRKPRDERKLVFAAMLTAEARAVGFTSTPDMPGTYRDRAIARAAETAEATGRAFPDCLRERLLGGLRAAFKSGKPSKFAIVDWEPPRGSQTPFRPTSLDDLKPQLIKSNV